MASEHRTLFAFYRPGHEVTNGNEVQVAEFDNCLAVMFGFPNGEALAGHRFWGRGLEFYALHEILESAWLRDVGEVEGAHSSAPSTPFADVKHHVLTFRDTTLEGLARHVRPVSTHAAMAVAVSAMATVL